MSTLLHLGISRRSYHYSGMRRMPNRCVQQGMTRSDWGAIFADNVIASAILDRLLHRSTTINIKGESYRLKDKKKAGVVAAKSPGKEEA